jgi:hypothetical protein
MDNTPALPMPTPPVPPIELYRSFCLQGYSYGERATLLPELTHAFSECGGWVLERRTISSSTMEFRLELQLRGIAELYSALVAAGVELTRTAHTTLTSLCVCQRHSGRAIQLNQVLILNLELSFLEDVTLHSLLMTGAALA